jgi:hypothetical protein
MATVSAVVSYLARYQAVGFHYELMRNISTPSLNNQAQESQLVSHTRFQIMVGKNDLIGDLEKLHDTIIINLMLTPCTYHNTNDIITNVGNMISSRPRVLSETVSETLRRHAHGLRQVVHSSRVVAEALAGHSCVGRVVSCRTF